MTKIIVDCCRNHLGCPELIDAMILRAAENGADYVKFQIYNSARLSKSYFTLNEIASYQRHQLTDVQIQSILKTCKIAGIIPMFTIFTPDRIDFLKDTFEYKEVAIKIASPDMSNKKLIETVEKAFWSNEIFISTGMHTFEEVEIMKGYCRVNEHKSLYCISKYPTAYEDINFEYMRTFDGFSDHTLGLTASKKAIDNGIKYIEKHFTLSHKMPGKDVKVSIDPDELKELSTHRDMVGSVEKYKARWKY